MRVNSALHQVVKTVAARSLKTSLHFGGGRGGHSNTTMPSTRHYVHAVSQYTSTTFN